MSEKIKEGTIDIEPTWESLLPTFMEWIRTGNDEQIKTAEEHLLTMARMTDKYRQAQKKGKTMMRISQRNKNIYYELRTVKFMKGKPRKEQYLGVPVTVEPHRFHSWKWDAMVNKYDEELLKMLQDEEKIGQVRNIRVR